MPKLIAAQSLPCLLEEAITPYSIACMTFCGRLVRDRFNNLNQFSSLDWIDTVDNSPIPISESLSDLMDRRASEFAKGSLTIQWSGGVDSTALLLAIVKSGKSKEDFQIFYDQNSVEEYPKLFNWLKEQKFNLVEISKWRKALGKVDTDYITNGWCADQLFGSIFFHESPKAYFYTIEELLSKFSFPSGSLTKDQIEEASNVYKEAAKNSLGVDLQLAAELGWFINFSMKWTWVSSFNELFLCRTPSIYKTRPFYNTPYFQGWALNNYPNIKEANIYGSVPRHYKKQLKEYCNTVFPDEDFLNNKTKRPSWNSAISLAKESAQITIKTDEGFQILSYPLNVPNMFKDVYSSPFFTKFRK